jgi:fructokinase
MSAQRRAVVCFGEALIDLLARPAAAGAPRQFTEYAGGAPANVAVAIARLGGQARFVGMLAQDFFGDELLAQLATAGVDVSGVRRTQTARTALAFVKLDAHGERSFSFYRPPAADLLFRSADFVPETFVDCAVFHVSSNSLTEEPIAAATLAGMERARASGALVSMDLNLRSGLWAAGVDPTPRLWAALEQAELVKLDRSELLFLARASRSDAAALARLFAARAECVVITDGAAPLSWFTRAAGGRVETFRVHTIDTTAAGDAFCGGWLHALVSAGVRRDTLREFLQRPAALTESLRFACACGALATTRHGAFAAMPEADAVARLLETQP